MDRSVPRHALTVLVDTNVWIRHLTGEPRDQAQRATRLLVSNAELVLLDVVFAECVYVLESVYGLDPSRVATLVRSLLATPSVRVDDRATLDRALELYELAGIGFADAYLLARTELLGVNRIASFDRRLRARAESIGLRVEG